MLAFFDYLRTLGTLFIRLKICLGLAIFKGILKSYVLPENEAEFIPRTTKNFGIEILRQILFVFDINSTL